jgi:chemotaxis regulatin CheY-phosphate phosphatase CheZ
MSPRDVEDYDDEAPRRGERRPADSQYRVPETEAILRRVIDIIDSSPGMPMSASVRVNKEEVLELLDDAVTRLPDELRSARWLLKEREEFLARSRRDGEELIADAKSRVAHMVQRTEVVKAAELRAQQIVEEAEAAARRMRRETEDYCDQKLASFENVLAKVAHAVATGRSRLAAPTIEQAELGERDDPPTGATASVPVFDQDL